MVAVVTGQEQSLHTPPVLCNGFLPCLEVRSVQGAVASCLQGRNQLHSTSGLHCAEAGISACAQRRESGRKGGGGLTLVVVAVLYKEWWLDGGLRCSIAGWLGHQGGVGLQL